MTQQFIIKYLTQDIFAALFYNNARLEQGKCPTIENWLYKLLYIFIVKDIVIYFIVKYYTAVGEKNEGASYVLIWNSFQDVLNEKYKVFVYVYVWNVYVWKLPFVSKKGKGKGIYT